MHLKTVRLPEVSELEPRLERALDEVEKGLRRLVDRQLVMGDAGRSDILAVDSSGALLVLELKADLAGVGALVQAVRYVEWLEANLGLLARAYPEVKPTRAVRILLAAPGFDEDVRRLAKRLDIEVGFVYVTAVRDEESGDIGILVRTEEIERTSGTGTMIMSVQDILDYVSDETVRSEAVRVMDDIKTMGAAVVPWRGGKYRCLEFTVCGDPVAYLSTLRRSYKVEHYDTSADDWVKVSEMVSFDDWAKQSRPFVEASVRAAKAVPNESTQPAAQKPGGG